MFNERQTDAGLAAWFARTFGGDVRYVRERGGFMVNRGTHWADDVDGVVERLAKQTIAGIFTSLGDPETAKLLTSAQREALAKFAIRSEAKPRIDAAISLLRSEAGITIQQANLDPDPFLLGVGNGVVDLGTCALRSPRADEYVTRQAGCAFQPHSKCPTWITFLRCIMADDLEMVAFLQRAIGYSLTGDTQEQCIFLMHGGGANGKSVFLRAMRELLGGYGADAASDTFIERRDGAASNDLARLAGARFVGASEVDDGRRLAESLIKTATGGEAISARFLYSEFFSYVPQFKLWLAVNHLPVIRGDDHGIWRRVRRIPFTVTIPVEEQDRGLLVKLRREMPGILNWALEGYRMWRKDGLAAPAPVLRATEEYRAESDAIGEWIGQRCVVQANVSVQAKVLYDDYRKFTEDRGGMALSMKRWAQRLADRGFRKDEGRVVHYRGIGLCDLREGGDHFPGTSSYTHAYSDLAEKGRNGRNGRNDGDYEAMSRGD